MHPQPLACPGSPPPDPLPELDVAPDPPPSPTPEPELACAPPVLLLVVATHAPPTQVPLSQGEPSGFGAIEQSPVCGSHVPSLHASPPVHTTGLIPVHTPPWQRSTFVHASASSHTLPSGSGGVEHFPVFGSQVPAAWHGSIAVHVFGVPPVHTPAWQVSSCVHSSPSSHATPSGSAGEAEHIPVAGSHVPATWH
jgi:hypothetical protein